MPGAPSSVDSLGCSDLMAVRAQAEGAPRGRTNVRLGQEWKKLASTGLPPEALGLWAPSAERLRAVPSPRAPQPREVSSN